VLLRWTHKRADEPFLSLYITLADHKISSDTASLFIQLVYNALYNKTPRSAYLVLQALCFYYTAQGGHAQTVNDRYG